MNLYVPRHIASACLLAGLENLKIIIYHPILSLKAENVLIIGQGKPGKVREYHFLFSVATLFNTFNALLPFKLL